MKTMAFTRFLAVFAVVIACVVMTFGGTAFAAPAPAPAPVATSVVTLKLVGPNLPALLPPGAPSGCTPGYFCTYNEGNGGDFCQQFYTTQNLALLCENANESAYNYENVYVNLYWGLNETGAYLRLAADSYLLYMQNNTFNACPGGGTSCSGYGEAVGDNVESVYIP